MSQYRLRQQPGEVLDRSRTVEFLWDGRRHQGFQGDTIVSAIAAEGVRVFSRSFKYHRPRGVLTGTYHDPNLTVQVGDDPNVRGAHRLIEPGMVVTPQNSWPTLGFDLKSANRMVKRFLPPGFYYKTFKAPRRLWPTYQKVLSRFAAGGVIPPEPARGLFDHRYAHPDVVVAGGGPAGMAAALGAAEAGASVMLVEEEHHVGGHLRWGDEADLHDLEDLRRRIAGNPAIEVLTDSVVTGRYDHNWIGIAQRSHPHVTERLVIARAKTLVVAAGTLERPYVFEGNDLPGVMLSTAVRRFIKMYAVRPGDRAVVMTANESGDRAASDLRKAGVDVEILDARAGQGVSRALGSSGVSAVEDNNGRRIKADLLVTATGWTTPTSLLNMAGDRPSYSASAARFLSESLPGDVLATGGIVGDGSTEELVAHGEATGAEAARRAEVVAVALRNATPTHSGVADSRTESVPIPHLDPGDHPELYRSNTHGYVDFSEDVTSSDLYTAVAEGYDSMELTKRYTTVNMGPVQGKVEAVNALAVHSEATQTSLLENTTTTWRPPYAPVRLGTLAGRQYEPVRYSPMQRWHEANNATPILAGQWVRPDHYGDPSAEVKAVRNGVGIIDVSPLGKLDLRGRDVPRLLEFAYVNKWSRLDIGKVRYGVMCGEDGVIMDDGVTGRLGPDHYIMSTTSGGAGNVWNWLDDWLQTAFPEWEIAITAVTDGYASINVAGPSSRELLGRITDIDLRSEAFGYMEVRTGTVAGVSDCFVWRIGFTGELSYEIHIPAHFGLHVWTTLLEMGSDLGVTPFGLEAQRIMRLEKGHFIVGQDTDGLTQAFGVGVDWAIKLDKPDFAGKPELAWQKERSDYPRLVAIQTEDPAIVPPEASQIITGFGDIRGRVTSSRFSPTLDRSICLGQVHPELAGPGQNVNIRLPNGATVPATVLAEHAHFDPEGVRMRV